MALPSRPLRSIPLHSLATLACLLLLYSAGNAQSKPCALSIDQLPEVRGFKLGMTVEQIKRRFPNFDAPESDKFGFAEFEYNFMLERGSFESVGEERKEPLDGIDTKNLGAITLAFLDDHLVVLIVSYNTAAEWRDIDEFFNVLTSSLKLPDAALWSKVNQDTRRYVCDSYFIEATTRPRRGSSSIQFYRRGLKQELEKREQEAKDKERQGFKP